MTERLNWTEPNWALLAQSQWKYNNKNDIGFTCLFSPVLNGKEVIGLVYNNADLYFVIQVYHFITNYFNCFPWFLRAFLMTQTVKNPPAMWKTWVRSLGWEDPREEGAATHSSILAWRIPWTEEPGRLYIVHGVAKSQTWLSDFHFLFSHVKGLPWGLQQ